MYGDKNSFSVARLPLYFSPDRFHAHVSPNETVADGRFHVARENAYQSAGRINSGIAGAFDIVVMVNPLGSFYNSSFFSIALNNFKNAGYIETTLPGVFISQAEVRDPTPSYTPWKEHKIAKVPSPLFETPGETEQVLRDGFFAILQSSNRVRIARPVNGILVGDQGAHSWPVMPNENDAACPRLRVFDAAIYVSLYCADSARKGQIRLFRSKNRARTWEDLNMIWEAGFFNHSLEILRDGAASIAFRRVNETVGQVQIWFKRTHDLFDWSSAEAVLVDAYIYPESYEIRLLAAEIAGRPATLYIIVDTGIVYSSQDGGRTWQR